jgi:hypothetical protein
MLKNDLAKELRERQYRYGNVSRELIDALSDDAMIDCYVVCSCCGEKQVDAEQLPRVIEDAQNAMEFIDACSASAELKSHMDKSIDGILRKKGF